MNNLLFENTTTKFDGQGSVNTSLIEAMADWCDALHGEMPLSKAFAGLVHAFGAEAGMLVRNRLNGTQPMKILTHDARESSGYSLRTSFGDEYFGPHLVRPRAATVWLGSEHSDEECAKSTTALPEWQASRRMAEFAVLILAGGPRNRDHIELHFREALSPDVLASLTAVVPAMARTWATRRVGLVTRESVSDHAPDVEPTVENANLPLLGIGNPARLSRAEFRVCLLLSRGLSVVGVSRELEISEATIRSHLRSVYSKTGSASLAALVFQLIQSQVSSCAWESRSA